MRQRQFVVVDVDQGLPAAELRASDPVLGNKLVPTTGEVQHKVTLSSVEDDALGEELQVIWEMEPGARTLEKNSLPDPVGFDTPARLDTYLNAVRWGAVSHAEVRTLQAPFRSGIDLETYQLDPVTRAIQMPRVNLLIADDVGLGKTIEAGLVAQELIIRHRARTVLVICPPSLQIQWRDQMRDRFGLEFKIVDAELQKELRRNRGLRVNPWSHFPRLITSIDFIKRERPLRLLKQLLPARGESPYPRRFDLLILDEAHIVAPAGQSHYIADSRRTETLRQLVPHFEHKLFLSATPHNGYPESFNALLELLDDQRFSRGLALNRPQLERVMVRRLKEDIRKFDDAPAFPERKIKELPVEYSAEERAIHQKLANYVRLRLDRGANSAQERFANQFVLTLLKKRLFSSPAAFYKTLGQHLESLETRENLLSFPSNAHTLHNRLEEITEEADFDAGDYDAGEDEFAYDRQLEDALSAALDEAARVTGPLQADEDTLLREMYAWAKEAERQPDSKARVLFQKLKELLKPDGVWGTRRVIIFTEYRTTQRWLQEMLTYEGLADSEHLALLYGGMPDDKREAIKAAFQVDPSLSPLRILLATDAASEGIDLQNHCSHLIHYEIPWNPNRLEQRNGRIDRHGQKAAQVDIFHFVGSRYRSLPQQKDDEREIFVDGVGTLDGDLEYLWRALNKVEKIRVDLGTVGPVIAEQVAEAMLRGKKTLDTRKAQDKADQIRKDTKFEKDMRKEVAKLREKLDESIRALQLEPENVRAVVETALAVANQPPLRPIIQYDAQGQHPVEAFVVPPLNKGWREATRGLLHPHTGQQRPVVFDPLKAKGRDDVVLAHLNHTLVSLSLSLLRAATWRADVQKNLHRVTARVVPARFLSQVAVVAHARLVILGGDSQRLHEEIIQAGGTLQAGRFTIMKKEDLERALAHATTQTVPPEWQARLAADWEGHEHKERLRRALENVQNGRVKSLEKALTERQEQETQAITEVLQELRRMIEQELVRDVYQTSLWEDDELQQWKRDRAALRVRAESIADEIAQEQRLIARRYSERTPYLFPVAVTFLVPEHVL